MSVAPVAEHVRSAKEMASPPVRAATVAVTCIPAFMVGLDNLVVVTALAPIRDDLRASLEQLSWTVSA